MSQVVKQAIYMAIETGNGDPKTRNLILDLLASWYSHLSLIVEE